MKVDAYTSEPHYFDHVLPVWLKLPEEHRGRFYVGADVRVLHRAAERLPLHELQPGDPRRDSTEFPTLVAAHRDLAMTPNQRPVILLEHGAGQTYEGLDHGGYSGGRDRGQVRLFLCPNGLVAERNRARYPDARAVVVGSPYVEELRARAVARSVLTREWVSTPKLAFSFHWDCSLVPETRSAWSYYRKNLPELRDYFDRVRILAHAHPKLWPAVHGQYDALGFEPREDFDELLGVELYMVDNSSTLYEFAAATDRPVLALDAPWYRRDVNHGLRFWDKVPGLRLATSQTWTAEDATTGLLTGGRVGASGLVEAVVEALADRDEIAKRRREVVADVFGEIPGSAQRAVDAIMETFG